jgi:hypothetical protein
VTTGRLYLSRAAARRRDRAVAFLTGLPAGTEVLIVSASRGAADDVARELARRTPATFGIHRFSLTQLAARLAATRLAASGLAPATALGRHAIAARAVFEARQAGALDYFSPVAAMPGFAPALTRTLQDLRMADVRAGAIRNAGEGGPDIAGLYDAAVAQFALGGSADRASLFRVARDVLESGAAFCERKAILLTDVGVDTPVERAFVETLLERASIWLACTPTDDVAVRRALEAIASTTERDEEVGSGELNRLRQFLFQSTEPPRVERGNDVVFFSAPG